MSSIEKVNSRFRVGSVVQVQRREKDQVSGQYNELGKVCYYVVQTHPIQNEST